MLHEAFAALTSQCLFGLRLPDLDCVAMLRSAWAGLLNGGHCKPRQRAGLQIACKRLSKGSPAGPPQE